MICAMFPCAPPFVPQSSDILQNVSLTCRNLIACYLPNYLSIGSNTNSYSVISIILRLAYDIHTCPFRTETLVDTLLSSQLARFLQNLSMFFLILISNFCELLVSLAIFFEPSQDIFYDNSSSTTGRLCFYGTLPKHRPMTKVILDRLLKYSLLSLCTFSVFLLVYSTVAVRFFLGSQLRSHIFFRYEAW